MFKAILRNLAVSARLIRPLRRLVRSESGSSAIEFAFVAAPFLALLVALFQTGVIFLAGRELDEATYQASRSILTGQAQSWTQNQFASQVCQNIYALFNCGGLMINVTNTTSFSSVSTTAPTLTFNAQGQVTNAWTFSPGGPTDLVVVQVMYEWPVVLGPLGFSLSNLSNGNRLLISTVVFRNEPY